MPAIWIPKRLVEISLINTAAESAQSFVSHCEIEYESRVLAAAEEILLGGQHIVMLTGPSASGKTTTGHKLAEKFKKLGHAATVVSLDDFYRNIEDYQYKEDGTKDYESVESLDVELINESLLALIEKGEAWMPEFNFVTEHREDNKHLLKLSKGVVIVEGIHALNPRLTSSLPNGSFFRVYAGLREEYSYKGQRILPTRDIRLARRMVRDAKFRGSPLEKTIAMWPEVCFGEDSYIKVYKPEADLLLDTSFSYEICCLAPFVTSLQSTLGTESPEAKVLNDLSERFSLCTPLPESYIPIHSMLREFIGHNG